MQPCLFKRSLAESRSVPAAAVGFLVPACTEGRGLGLLSWPRAKAGQVGDDLPSPPSVQGQHCLQKDQGPWIPPLTGDWPLDGEVRDTGVHSRSCLDGRAKPLKSFEGGDPNLEQVKRA